MSAEGVKIKGVGVGVGEGPLPRKFLNFEIKMTCFDALWSMDFILNVPASAREGS